MEQQYLTNNERIEVTILRNLIFNEDYTRKTLPFIDEIYFTRRATGYPGPGIIPSPPRNAYLTVEIKL